MEQTAVKPGTPLGTAISARTPDPSVSANGAPHASPGPEPRWKQILTPIASLRLTVWLFALSMVIVFYGTLAQKDHGIWHVMDHYFRCKTITWIPLHVVLFRAIDPVGFAIPFPGGWVLGALLMTNLLAAHAVRFKLTWKRSGIFVLHAGVIVMMLSEFITGIWAVEGMMSIIEGDKTNYVQHFMHPEIAVIDNSDPKFDDTVAIPHAVFRRGKIEHEKLPFAMELVAYYPNSRLDKEGKTPKLATAGFGVEQTVVQVAEGTGTDTDQKFDMPAAFVKLTSKTGDELGTYLLFYEWREQRVKVGDKTYEVSLRPKRSYRPYTYQLVKAEFKKYPGTNIAKDYSSYIRILDENGKETRAPRIWMNNPLYFNGETYYQSSMQVEPGRPVVTGLQVVRDPGKWIPLGLPIISCIMVGVGMMIHFSITLFDFLQRRAIL